MPTTVVTPRASIPLDSVFRALASEHRREILRLLSDAETTHRRTGKGSPEVCACKISKHLSLSAPTTSHHLAVLREAGLVRARRAGTWMLYELDRDVLARAAAALTEL